jgi:hypothetical protein
VKAAWSPAGRSRVGTIAAVDIFERVEEFPPFDCADCGSSSTWTSPIPVTAGGQVVAWAPGPRVCWDCWERVNA